MYTLATIQQLIDEDRHDTAIDCLDEYIAANPGDDEAYLMRGRAYWRLQKYARAVSDFETAVFHNPQSDAGAALELARDVFNFYNPDLLNP